MSFVPQEDDSVMFALRVDEKVPFNDVLSMASLMAQEMLEAAGGQITYLVLEDVKKSQNIVQYDFISTLEPVNTENSGKNEGVQTW